MYLLAYLLPCIALAFDDLNMLQVASATAGEDSVDKLDEFITSMRNRMDELEHSNKELKQSNKELKQSNKALQQKVDALVASKANSEELLQQQVVASDMDDLDEHEEHNVGATAKYCWTLYSKSSSLRSSSVCPSTFPILVDRRKASQKYMYSARYQMNYYKYLCCQKL